MERSKQFENLLTEKRNQETLNIDRLSTAESVALICREDQKVVEAVRQQIPAISAAVDVAVQSLQSGGRLFYVGAGTSGRIGVLDAAELLPTFGVGEEMVCAIMAGGEQAFFQAVEGAEDDREAGAADLLARRPRPGDVVVGIAASGRTPYVLGAVEAARQAGLGTIGITCNPQSALETLVDVIICAVVGPEVITGSTRMKAGTAQKLILNTLSTVSMIKLGKVYQNLMVDMKPTNSKLRRRAETIVCEAVGIDRAKAHALLQEAEWNIKRAIVMGATGCHRNTADHFLREAKGFVAAAIDLGHRQIEEGREGNGL